MYTLGTGSLRFKAFETLNEATEFANKQPLESVLEIRIYNNDDIKKPDRN